MPLSTLKSERRKKSRRSPQSLIYVELASGNGGMMRDLNEEGFAVRAMMPLRAGENATFSFSLNDSVRIEGECEILWVQENGRIAGARFTQVPPTARAQIQDWLSAPEAPSKGNEIPGKPVAPPTPTLDQLREEIRSVPVGVEPPRTPRAVPAPPLPEKAPGTREDAPSAPPPENGPASLQAFAPIETPLAPAAEPPPSSTSIPVLPPVNETPYEIVSPVESLPDTRTSIHDAFVSVGAANPFRPLELPENEAETPQVSPKQRDISEILMQPSGKPTSHPPNLSPYDRIASVEPETQTPQASRIEWFTLTRAVIIMICLTFVVAASAYHRELGNFLIWLGEKMGGTQIIQSQQPEPQNAVPAGTPIDSSSSPSDSSRQPVSAEPATGGDRPDAGNTSMTGNNPQSSLSAVAKNSLSPITPLSGISNPSSSNNSLETGQTEYLQAMHLLRGKNASADPSEALRLLWISVEKGNPSAELALADMYWHGQGVTRNCDQTRILLSAAARKGNPEAQKRLQLFQREGCE